VQRSRDHVFSASTFFAGDCGSRRDAGNVGVSRPCATGSGRANTETNPRHYRHQPTYPPTAAAAADTTTVNDAAPSPPTPVVSTTISPSPLLLPLPPPPLPPPPPPPPLFREPSDSLPFNRYPSPPPTTIMTNTTISSSRVGESPPSSSLRCRFSPRLPTRQVDTNDASTIQPPRFLLLYLSSNFAIPYSSECTLPSLLHLSFVHKCAEIGK